MAPVDLRAAPQPQSRLLSLPAELQIVIFKLAYHRSSDTKIISKADWRDQQRNRRRAAADKSQFTKRPFPAEKVMDFMVSKEFLALAGKQYVCSQPAAHLQAHVAIAYDDNLFVRFAEHYVSDSLAVEYLLNYAPSIKKLTLELDEDDFLEVPYDFLATDEYDTSDDDVDVLSTSQRVFTERLTSRDFEKTSLYRTLQGLTRYVEIHIQGRPSAYLDLSADKTEMFNTNLADYRACAKKLLARFTSATVSTTDVSSRRQPAWANASHASSPAADRLARMLSSEIEIAPADSAEPARLTDNRAALGQAHPSNKRPRPLPEGGLTDSPKKRKTRYSKLATSALTSYQGFSLSPGPASLASFAVTPQTAHGTVLRITPVSPIAFSLSSALPQLESLLDAEDPELIGWIAVMKEKGKL